VCKRFIFLERKPGRAFRVGILRPFLPPVR
jgi:hypothetical protein